MFKFNLISTLIPALSMGIMRMAESSGSATILDLDAMMDIEMDKVETLPDYGWCLRVVCQ